MATPGRVRRTLQTEGEKKDREATRERLVPHGQKGPPSLLAGIWDEVQSLPNSWTFPAENDGVDGFAGPGPIFVVGEQPSTSRWPTEDPGRRLLYDSLVACGLEHAHLTDIIKSRGAGHEWRKWSPDRLKPHIDLFRRELDALRPWRLILLGAEARKLFLTHFPDKAEMVRKIYHFGYLRRVPLENRVSWQQDYRRKLCEAAKP
jgi:hypothetical protein